MKLVRPFTGPFARNFASYAQRMLHTEQAQLLRMDHVQPLLRRHVQEGRAVAWGVLPRAAEHRALPRPLVQWHLVAIRGGCSTADLQSRSGGSPGRPALPLSSWDRDRRHDRWISSWRLHGGHP